MAHLLDMSKLSEDSVDVEAIATELARYTKITSEDAEVLSHDPTRRDKLIAELYRNPAVRPEHQILQIVAPGGNPDDYLGPANAAIASLTPPKSFEDRITRLHIAWPAATVYFQHKVVFALPGSSKLMDKVMIRYTKIMQEWSRTDSRVRFSPPGFGGSTMASALPALASLPTPPPSREFLKQVSEDMANDFLRNPDNMIGKLFVHDPPQESRDSGTWEVISYTAKKGDGGGLEQVFQVSLEAFGTNVLPMDKEEVKEFLKYSNLYVV
ncbi:hypothetical protein EIP91_009389 [Steccherinum ochraceum]|uniref:Uncharacterized protein n=1 Tax=Steccherinum ochraceum TaxID=92696 RepID=A0A4R0R1P6_9APHY|nr:hypothetical protein EIP91_009389 [Steccherinum ochraceum]